MCAIASFFLWAETVTSTRQAANLQKISRVLRRCDALRYCNHAPGHRYHGADRGNVSPGNTPGCVNNAVETVWQSRCADGDVWPGAAADGCPGCMRNRPLMIAGDARWRRRCCKFIFKIDPAGKVSSDQAFRRHSVLMTISPSARACHRRRTGRWQHHRCAFMRINVLKPVYRYGQLAMKPEMVLCWGIDD